MSFRPNHQIVEFLCKGWKRYALLFSWATASLRQASFACSNCLAFLKATAEIEQQQQKTDFLNPLLKIFKWIITKIHIMCEALENILILIKYVRSFIKHYFFLKNSLTIFLITDNLEGLSKVWCFVLLNCRLLAINQCHFHSKPSLSNSST